MIESIIKRYSEIQFGRKVSFLQIGSNDGASGDPLHKTIVRCRWSGICVEPIRQYYELLTDTYRGNSDVACVNGAVGRTQGKATMYRLASEHCRKPMWADQVASLSSSLVAGHLGGVPDSSIEEEEVDLMTFEDLLARHTPMRDIRVYHSDVEGMDCELLFNYLRLLDRHDLQKPDLALFEHNHLRIEGPRLLRRPHHRSPQAEAAVREAD